ncbi:MAG: hypothetical protein JWM98_2062 [Thermoleophilia bacterium]|nr:hypothetical protein [Thermoleophilia bacterium]
MPIDPMLLRPFLGEVTAARSHVGAVRSAIDSLAVPGADVDSLLFEARMDAGFASASLREASRHAAPRDAATGALELADSSGQRFESLLGGLDEAIRAAGGTLDAPAVVDRMTGVRRATDRMLRWDLDEVARTATTADEHAALGVADERGHWTSFDDLAMRELGGAAAVVDEGTRDLMHQLDGLGRGVDEAGGRLDDAPLSGLDDEIAIDEGVRALHDITTPAQLEELGNRAGRSLEARAANAADTIPNEVHAAGAAPALAPGSTGMFASGSDALLDAAPANGDVVAKMVMRGKGEVSTELPLIANGRNLHFPTRESAEQTLTGEKGSWVLSPERAGGWRAIQVESSAGEAADAILAAYGDHTLNPSALRGEHAAVRGFVVEGTPHPLRSDAPDRGLERALGEFSGFRPTESVSHAGYNGLPRPGAPLVAMDVQRGWLRGMAGTELTAGTQSGTLIEGTRADGLQALREQAARVSTPRAFSLLQLDVGRYALVETEGAAAKDLHRALGNGAAPRVLDPRVEAIAVGNKHVVRGIDLASGTPITDA